MLSYTWKDDDYDEVTNWWTFVRVPTFIGKKFVNETMDLKDVTHD